MFISRRSLPRRTFLRGMGAALALPFLESMVPAFTAMAQTAASPQRRLGFVYFPNGAVIDTGSPRSGLEDQSPILKPLEPYRDQMIVVGNLARAGGRRLPTTRSRPPAG